MPLESLRMEMLVFQLIFNDDEVSANFGLKFNLADPIRCRTMQEVADLPFISERLHKGQNEVYFQYREDLEAHVIHLDPHPNKDTVIVAFAQFVEPEDTRAVDPPLVG